MPRHRIKHAVPRHARQQHATPGCVKLWSSALWIRLRTVLNARRRAPLKIDARPRRTHTYRHTDTATLHCPKNCYTHLMASSSDASRSVYQTPCKGSSVSSTDISRTESTTTMPGTPLQGHTQNEYARLVVCMHGWLHACLPACNAACRVSPSPSGSGRRVGRAACPSIARQRNATRPAAVAGRSADAHRRGTRPRRRRSLGSNRSARDLKSHGEPFATTDAAAVACVAAFFARTLRTAAGPPSVSQTLQCRS